MKYNLPNRSASQKYTIYLVIRLNNVVTRRPCSRSIYHRDPSFSIHIVGRNPYCEVSVQLATQVWSRSKYKYLMLHYLRSCRCLCTRMSVLSLISPTQRRYLDTSRYVHHSFLDARVSVWRLFFFRVSLDLLLFFGGLWSLKSEYRKYDKSLPCSHKVRPVHLSKRMKNLTKPLRDIFAKGDCQVETDQCGWRDGDNILTRG